MLRSALHGGYATKRLSLPPSTAHFSPLVLCSDGGLWWWHLCIPTCHLLTSKDHPDRTTTLNINFALENKYSKPSFLLCVFNSSTLCAHPIQLFENGEGRRENRRKNTNVAPLKRWNVAVCPCVSSVSHIEHCESAKLVLLN